MKIRSYAALVMLLAPMIYGQKISPDRVVSAKPGQPIVLELVADIGPEDLLSWKTLSGKGTIRIMDSKQKKIEVVPEGPGDTLVVVCIIVPAHGQQKQASAQISLQPDNATPPPANSTPESATASAAVHPPSSPTPQPPVVSQPKVVPTPALQAVTTGDIDRLGFIPAGFMGSAQDGQTVDLNQGSTNQPHSLPTCIRIAYTPETAENAPKQSKVPWFAIAWQYTGGEPNFGDLPGRNLELGVADSAKFHSLRVWARGELNAGRPPIVQFKSGGGTKRDLPDSKQASYEVVDQFRPLTPTWTEYCLDVPAEKLTNVVSAFTLVMERAGNPNGAVVYLDDIHFSVQTCPGAAGH